MKTFLDKLLDFYQLDEETYQKLLCSPSIDDIPSYEHFDGIDKIDQRIKEAIDNKEKIMIYGDYDCDGVIATSILVKCFKLLGIDVGYYLPSRYIDGYGLNVSKVEEIHQKGYSLIITVDNGITAFDAINKANEYHIDVIVTDHHQQGDVLPNAYTILHPLVSNYGNVVCSGGYVAFMLASKLLSYYDDYLLSLASISTISDLMSLKDYNFNLCRLGLILMNKHHYLQLLLLNESSFFDENSIAMKIAPKVNAVGRMDETININRLVRYFVSDNEKEINTLYLWINKLNEERKTAVKEKTVLLDDIKSENENGIVTMLDIKEGLVGLMANRLMTSFNCPSIVFSSFEDEKGIIRGSARSRNGFNLINAFNELNSYCLESGGHALAAGIAIKKEDLLSFKNEFLLLCDQHHFIDETPPLIEISITDINLDNYQTLLTFGPFGMDHPKPGFLIRGLKPRSFLYVSGGKHIVTPLNFDTKLVAFNIDKNELIKHSNIDAYGVFEMNYYKNSSILQFRIERFLS